MATSTPVQGEHVGRPTRASDLVDDLVVVPDRWRRRPTLAALLRLVLTVAPAAAVFGVVAVVDAQLPFPHSVGGQAAWVVAVFAASMSAAFLVERVARRFLPLVTLLRLTLVFPDQAPSRYRVMRAAASPARLRELAAQRDEVGGAAGQVLLLLAELARHDKHTRGHSERVRVFADLIGEQLGITGLDREKLRWGALLHDIGKISVPAEILNKPGRPTSAEWRALQRHPAAGEAHAGELFAWLGPWAGGITQHHERFDGKGYPAGLSGSDISLGGRIVAVADCYETMTAARAYKKPMAAGAARREIADCAGSHFDPVVARAFLEVSLPTLFWRIGPASFLLHLPFLGHLRHAGIRAAGSAAGVATPATVAGLGMATAITAGGAVVTPAAAAAIFETGSATAASAGTWTTAPAVPQQRAVAPATAAATTTAPAPQAQSPSQEQPAVATTAPAGSAAAPTTEAADPTPAATVTPGTATRAQAPVTTAQTAAPQVAATSAPTITAALGSTVAGTVSGLGQTVTAVGTTTGGLVNGVGDTVGALGSAVGTAVGGDVGGTVTNLTTAAGAAVGTVGDVAGTTVGAVGQTVTNLGTAVGGALGSFGAR